MAIHNQIPVGRDLARVGGLRRRPTARKPGSGFILIEAMIVSTVVLVGIMTSVLVVFQSSVLQEANSDKVAVHNACRRMMEEIRGLPFSEVVRRYNADPSDDPDGPGTAPGTQISVPGLHSVEGEAVNGGISFPTQLAAAGLELGDVSLTGSSLAQSLGITDQDGDGQVDPIPELKMLPVQIVVQWESRAGPVEMRFSSVLTDR